MGLVRQRVFSHYFGIETVAAEAWNAAFRIPNFLQNLFGEGVLSASFIPVYARLLAEKDDREAGRVAGAIGALLALVVSVIVLVGVLGDAATSSMRSLRASSGETRELTIRLVRILFPGAGLLVLSAWCLGILNSHRKFFLSYTAPVVWSVAMIAAMLVFGRRMDTESLVIVTRLGLGRGERADVPGAAAGGAAIRSADHLRSSQPAREVTRNFGPVFVSRGVVQISGYIDMAIASYVSRITPGAVAALGTAQTLYMLPVSLFGMSVSAAELPEMSSALAGAEIKRRLNAGLRQIAFFVVPSAMAFLAASATCSPRACSSPGASSRRMPSTCGAFWRARRSGCWRRRSGGCIPRPTMRSATRARRCGSP